MGRVIFVHHHIFKNAGTSFNYALRQQFGEHFFEFDLPDGQAVTQTELHKFIQNHSTALAISSHHACMPTPQGEDYQTISSILLRKPLARVRSIYEFERKQIAQTQGAIRAKELNFKDYVTWRMKATPVMFGNYQTHYCSRTGNYPPDYITTETDLEVAIQNIKNCAVIGTVEHYDETLALAKIKLSKFFPDLALESVHLNNSRLVSQDYNIRDSLVADLGEDIVCQLEASNQLDKRLYEFVDEYLKTNLENLRLLK